MKNLSLPAVLGLAALLALPAMAQEPGTEPPASDLLAKLQTIDLSSPDMELSQTKPPAPPAQLGTNGTSEEWESMKTQMGVQEGWNPKKGVFIASQAVVVGAKPGSPNFIQSRVIAFQKAEMQAKGELASFMATTLGGKSSLKVFEGPENQKLAEEMGESANQMASEEFESVLTQTAAGMLVGTQVLATFEAKVEGGYEVRAAVAWSENLNRLANTFVGAAPYQLRMKGTGKSLQQIIDCDNPAELLNRFGCKIYVDQTGKLVAVSYGQAQARVVSKSREAAAISRAQGKAKLSALAALRRFLNEETSLARRFEEREKIVEREGSENVEQILESLYSAEFVSESQAIDVSGASTFCTWSATHPASDQTVVGAVVTLTADAQSGASAMKAAMESGGMEPGPDEPETADTDPW